MCSGSTFLFYQWNTYLSSFASTNVTLTAGYTTYIFPKDFDQQILAVRRGRKACGNILTSILRH